MHSGLTTDKLNQDKFKVDLMRKMYYIIDKGLKWVVNRWLTSALLASTVYAKSG